MKKLFALLLALCMALSAFGAVAEETVNEINWSDVEPLIAEQGWEGNFYAFEQFAAKLWIPAGMVPYEMSEEEIAEGYVAWFGTEDGSAFAAVCYYDAQGLELADLAASMAEDGTEDVELGLVNGLGVLTFSDSANDTASMIVAVDNGWVVQVVFAPMSDEGFAAVASIIMASFQTAE